MNPAQIKVKVTSNKRFKNTYWHLEFESAIISRQAVPGQFVNIRVSDCIEPLLRRPISIHRTSGLKVKLFYKVLGKGTQILSSRKPGELLDIIGPLGNGFAYNRTGKRQAIIVAGGMGVSPLVFLAEKIKLNKPLVLIGAKTKKQILCMREFKALGCKLKLATDDGSLGFKGSVTELLSMVLAENNLAEIFACGPQPMLKAVVEIACAKKIASQVSLEEHMACGFGACLGCAVTTKSGYKRVCKDGPVFSGQELTW